MSERSQGSTNKLVGRASLPAYDNSQSLEPRFTTYRRNLPHWRLTGATYFVTWRLDGTQPELEPIERDLIVTALRHFDRVRYELLAWVVMDNHVHALVKPSAGHRLEEILHSWKSFTAHSFQRHHGRVGRIWQEESYDRIVRDENDFWEKSQYIAENPLRRWPQAENYAWVGSSVPE